MQIHKFEWAVLWSGLSRLLFNNSTLQLSETSLLNNFTNQSKKSMYIIHVVYIKCGCNFEKHFLDFLKHIFLHKISKWKLGKFKENVEKFETNQGKARLISWEDLTSQKFKQSVLSIDSGNRNTLLYIVYYMHVMLAWPCYTPPRMCPCVYCTNKDSLVLTTVSH